MARHRRRRVIALIFLRSTRKVMAEAIPAWRDARDASSEGFR
jgi:hypothetical protein